MTVVLGAIYVIAVFGLFVAVGVHWISRRKEIRSSTRFAWAVVGVYTLAMLAVVVPVATGGSWLLAFMWPVDVLRTFLFTAVGLSCCAAAGVVAFPLLKPDLGARQSFVRPSLFVPASFGLLLAGTWSAYSVLLFDLTSPELTDAAKRLSGEFGVSDGRAMAMLGVSVVALGEELVFRLGIQNYIARIFGWWDRRYWLAILLSATLWSLGHVGTLEPGWVKLAQVFPAGLALGWLARKHGIEACILAHVVFNIAAFMMAEAGLLRLG